MSRLESNPPRLAIWLLQHARPANHNQALLGDLVEKFREGRSHGWFWKQVLIAIAVAVLGAIQRHWPEFSYAIAGLIIPVFLWKTVHQIPLPWSALPWPWSQIVFDLGPTLLLALTTLLVLAAALVINQSFRWMCLFRTGMIQLALTVLSYYVLEISPWLFRPVPGYPYLKTLIVPSAFQLLLIFSGFQISAWIGCLPSRQRMAQAPS